MKKQSIIGKLAALKNASVPQLKEKWKELYGTDAPSFNRQYLESRLTYRIQELAYGGLSKDTQTRLRDLAENNDAKLAKKPTFLTVGTMLQKEWRGTMYSITVLADGFEYEGKRFRSLSGVAREITGTNWNGHAFFGLKKRKI